MIKELFLEAVHLNNAYTGNGMYMGFYYVTIIFILFFKKDKMMRVRIAYPAMIMLVFILAGAPVLKLFVPNIFDKDTGGRLFWTLFITLVTAYGMTSLVQALDESRKRVLLVLLLIPVIFLSGVFKFSDALYTTAENEYRLPQNGIDICEVVLEERDEPKLLVPYEIAHIFRQYSTKIKLLYGEDASYGRIFWAKNEYVKACNEMDSTSPDVGYVVSLAYQENCDFIIFDEDYHVLNTAPELYGFDYYKTIDHYKIYQRRD